MTQLRIFIAFTFSILGFSRNFSQSIYGNFPQLKNAEIILTGYEGFHEKELTKTKCSEEGTFMISYPQEYRGAALLQIENGTSLNILLNQENFSIEWQDIQSLETLKFYNSIENDFFEKGVNVYQTSENKLTGLKYLLPQYEDDKESSVWIRKQISLQESLYNDFVEKLPKESYAQYYLKIRKLISDMPVTALNYPDRISKNELDFSLIDFKDDRLWNSGLIGELLEGFYQLMESYGDLDLVYKHADRGTDAWISSLNNDKEKLEQTTDYVFRFLEKRSLFGAAEHLALTMLSQELIVNTKLSNILEQYRKMATGNIAPDIELGNGETLWQLVSDYKLIVFGESQCPRCEEELKKLKEVYNSLKERHDLKIIYISLDSDKLSSDSFIKDMPFLALYEEKGWETQAAKDYYISSIPAMLLLDRKNKILERIVDIDHLQAWFKAK